MKIKIPLWLLLPLLAGGCASLRPPLAGIALEQKNSSCVLVAPPHLSFEGQHLMLGGTVLRPAGVFDTARAHLDIRCYGANGRFLGETTAEFFPRQIPTSSRVIGRSQYFAALHLDPASVARVVVIAHDGPLHRPSAPATQ